MQNEIILFIKSKDPDKLKDVFHKAYHFIPNDLWQKENEQNYHALVHLIFSLLGVYIFSEAQTHKGRTDSM
ncbi:MAG: hypothetical protein IPJ13_03715 [Saprospiraceae bacterium]|nr:hypothetical protein [Saprospiraceae bacterium]